MEGSRIKIKGKALAQAAAVSLLFVLTYLFNLWLGLDLGLGTAVAVVLAMALGVLFTLKGDRAPVRFVEAVEGFEGQQDAALLDTLAEEQGDLGLAVVKALRGQQAKSSFYKQVIGCLRNPVLITDAEGRIILGTQALADFLKKPMPQILGHSLCQAFYNTKEKCFVEEALRTKKPMELQEEITLHDGRKATLRAFAAPLTDERGEVVGAMASLIDQHSIVERDRQRQEQTQRMIQVGRNVNDLAQRVASAAEELSASADEQARGAQKQKGQTDTVATAMEEMTATVLEVARNATATSEAAEGARTSAAEGVDMVQQAVTAINSVSESAASLSNEVSQLNSQAGEIGRIIAVINDIADQTNLLALNAAIEAARAGEAGRGFAVVADEVRKLAEKTMTATKEVEEAIKTIQSRSRLAVESMERTGARVTESTDLSNKAGEALMTITGAIEDMVLRVSQIATAAEEQSSAAEEINRSIEDIAQVAAESDEGAGQTAAATRDLAELSQELLNVAQGFGGMDASADKLRSAGGQMRGVLPKLAQDYVIKAHGQEVYQAMQEALGNPTFLPGNNYPDQVLRQMAEIVQKKAKVSPRDFFLGLGRSTLPAFQKLYPHFFRKTEGLKPFLLHMNDVHAQLVKEQPGMKPPRFFYEDKGEVLFLTYRSGRGLFDYFEGILLGAAEHLDERIQLKMIHMDEETVRAEIRFLG